MTELLGTAIRAGADAQRALLVSDLHLGGDGGAALAALDRVLAAAGDGGMPVFVLGDLFDSYVSRAQVRTGVWRAVAERFRRARDGACGRVVLLVGNRDFLLGDEFVRAAGCELVHGGYRLRLGDRDTLLLHGDELCQNDLPYQRAKRWLRSAPVRALARRLPLALAARAAERARQRSQNVVRRGDQTRFLPSRQAVARAFGLGIDRRMRAIAISRLGYEYVCSRKSIGTAHHRVCRPPDIAAEMEDAPVDGQPYRCRAQQVPSRYKARRYAVAHIERRIERNRIKMPERGLRIIQRVKRLRVAMLRKGLAPCISGFLFLQMPAVG